MYSMFADNAWSSSHRKKKEKEHNRSMSLCLDARDRAEGEVLLFKM